MRHFRCRFSSRPLLWERPGIISAEYVGRVAFPDFTRDKCRGSRSCAILRRFRFFPSLYPSQTFGAISSVSLAILLRANIQHFLVSVP